MSIVLDNVSKSFDKKLVLADFSYEFKTGGKYVLTGRSGIGKTTTLRLIMELIKPDKGSVEFGGDSHRCSVMFQEDRLLESFNAITNIKFTNDKLTDEAITSALNSLIPDSKLDKPVSAFSGGMKRKVALIRAMLAESDIVILDEPFTGMDEESIASSLEFINNTLGQRTLIMSSHISLPSGFTTIAIPEI